jgi:hypothetical protein
MDLHIGRLRLNVPAMSGPDAERLAVQIADGLAGARDWWPAGRSIENIHADLTSERGSVTDDLSAAIVAEIFRQLNRTA